MSAPRRRKKYPPLRLVETPKKKPLPTAVGFREHAFEKFAHWTNRPSDDAINLDFYHFHRLWCAWHRDRGTDRTLYDEPDFDDLAAEIYDANEAREAAKVHYPRLATFNGARVQA